ncbi:uncharacterized protein [Parasteatoda tepidariorum]|uniref:uncharacterized protein n=1 Tax=Parasteatoda tepidariorum TaxID=114398 RepID=UPI00077F88AF|nr:uncharacterized protein LOC107452049 [Parasteatoda tepidariorum]XP_015923817.1 uncharacterized protein LOC107452049 [Parasteatoda tepidariorum]
MDIERNHERNDNFHPVLILSEDEEKIALMKAALKAYTDEYERLLLSMQRRLIAGKKNIDICCQESNEIELLLNALENKVIEAQLLAQDSETEALQTIKDNRMIKRKIIALKNDIEEQEKLLKRANETMQTVKMTALNKKIKVLNDVT